MYFKKFMFVVFIAFSSLGQLKAMGLKTVFDSFDSDVIEKQMELKFKKFETKMKQEMGELDKKLREEASKFKFFRGKPLRVKEIEEKKIELEAELKRKKEEIAIKAREQARRNWELFLGAAKPLMKSAQYVLVATGKFTRQAIQDKSQALVKLQNLEGESLVGAGCLSAFILGVTYKIMDTMHSMHLIRNQDYKIIFKAISMMIAAKLMHKMYQVCKHRINQRKNVAPVQVNQIPAEYVQQVPEVNQNVQQYEYIDPNMNQEPYQREYPNLNQHIQQPYQEDRLPTYAESQNASAPDQSLVQDSPPTYDEIVLSAPEKELDNASKNYEPSAPALELVL